MLTPLVKKFIYTISIFAWLLDAGAVQAQDREIRIGIQAFPSVGGNPLGLVNLPGLYTFAALFDALTYVGWDGEAKPQLAKRWEAITPTRWRFTLHPDVNFSNGESFTARTVVDNIEIIQRVESKGFATASELAHIKGASAVDDLTVEIETHRPSPFLPHELSMLRFVPPRYWDEVGPAQFALDPIGTTPFKVDAWSGTELKLIKWHGSWRDAKVNRVTLFAVPNPSARLQGLLSGRLHIAMVLGPDEIPLIESAGHRVAVQPDTGMIILAFNLQKSSPLHDVRVRQALNFAVNKQGIVDGLLSGQSRVSSQTAPIVAFGYDPDLKPYVYDPDRAKQLLAEAGYPDGFAMVAEVLNTTSSFAGPAYQQVVADLARVGVRVELRAIPVPKYAKGLHQGQWDGEAFGIDYGIAPSLDALRAFARHSCLKQVPWYCDEEIMPLLNKALGTFDLKEREKLTRQVLKRQREQAPGILLYDLVRFDGVRQEVLGYQNHVGYVPYHELSLEDE